MTGVLRPGGSAPGAVGAEWAYWRPAVDGVVELGTLRGHDVGLPAHYHDEDQVTFVVSGRRRFFMGGRAVALGAGECTLIPAGAAHRSLPEPDGVVCVNAYLPAGDYAVAAMVRELERSWRRTGRIRWPELAEVVRGHRRGAKAEVPPALAASAGGSSREAVGRVASRAGMSREGFSRRFARSHGMPPHAFWLTGRLNRARGLLRAGGSIADVAAETGFADQSHLGRWFRRAFGVTPGRYRAGWARSQAYQTRP